MLEQYNHLYYTKTIPAKPSGVRIYAVEIEAGLLVLGFLGKW